MKPMQVNRSPGRAWRTKQECPSAYRWVWSSAAPSATTIAACH